MASDSDGLHDFKGFGHAPRQKRPTLQLKPPTIFDNFLHSVSGFMESVAHNFLDPCTEFPSKMGQAGKGLTGMSGVQAPQAFSSMLVSNFSWPQSRSSLSQGDDNNNSNIDNNSNNNSNKNNVSRGYPSKRRNSAVSRLPSDGIDWGSEKGPAFLGQVFSVVNPSGTGLLPVNRGVDPPFLRRAPKWIKKIFALVTKNDLKGPVFPFFLDIGDAVKYMKRLNIQSGMVGACRLDLAYDYFKEKPQLFQFVPNEKQVKEANKLLQGNSKGRANQLKGVPVFTAQNLSIVIATINGVRWYTPYFFDKKLLDNMLEVSIDQHFQWLIHNRYIRRRKEMVDDDFPAEMIEEHFESLLDPPEVQELMEEIGQAGVPLNSVISKAAEIYLYDAVDRVLLGNRWIRKATGIQPKIPFKVDSFEERTAASVSRAREQSIGIKPDLKEELETGTSEKSGANTTSVVPGFNLEERDKTNKSIVHESSQQSQNSGALHEERSSKLHPREPALDGGPSEQDLSDRILPKITIVSIFMSEPSQMNNASMKKTMEDLSREIDERNQRKYEFDEDKDPLFVANVGEFSDIESPRSVRERK